MIASIAETPVHRIEKNTKSPRLAFAGIQSVDPDFLQALFSFRTMTGVERIRSLLRKGELGKLFCVELIFHTTKTPVFSKESPQTGCFLTLGVPLLDVLLWCLDFPGVKQVSSRLCSEGKPLPLPGAQNEDFAAAHLLLETGAAVQISCSRNLPAGCETIIKGSFHGSKGGAEFRNVNGSCLLFTTAHWQGNQRKSIPVFSEPNSKSSALKWVRQLAQKPCYAPEIENLIPLASTVDQIYGR